WRFESSTRRALVLPHHRPKEMRERSAYSNQAGRRSRADSFAGARRLGGRHMRARLNQLFTHGLGLTLCECKNRAVGAAVGIVIRDGHNVNLGAHEDGESFSAL